MSLQFRPLRFNKTGVQGKVLRWTAIIPSVLAVNLALSLSFSSSSLATVGPGENPVQLRFAAIDAILHGNNKDALDLYETAIQEANQQYGPNSSFLADLNYEAGTVALDTSQFPMAEHYLTLAVKINPYLTMAKIKLAELYRLQSKPAEASKQFKQAVQINQTSPVTRQAYIRWLATNGTTAQENAIATQESLKLAMLNASSREMFNRPNDKSKSGAKNAPVLAPPLVAPTSGSAAQNSMSKEKTFGQETGAVNSASSSKPVENAKPAEKAKPAMSLFPFKNVKKDGGAEEEKKRKQAEAEKLAAREAEAKVEAARNAAKAAAAGKNREKAERAAREKAAREKAAREAGERAAQKARAAAKPKPVEKPATEEKPKEEAAEKVEIKKAEPKPVKKAEPKVERAAEQPGIVPSAPQTYQPQFQPQPMMYTMPIPQTKSKPKGGARTMVPPPPPTMPMYGQMMRPMPVYPPPQQPVPQPKPKSTPKPSKAEPKEHTEDKPPPMTNSSDNNEPDFILDWGDVKPKKRGK